MVKLFSYSKIAFNPIAERFFMGLKQRKMLQLAYLNFAVLDYLLIINSQNTLQKST